MRSQYCVGMPSVDVLSHGFPRFGSGFVVSGQSRAGLVWLLFLRVEQEQIILLRAKELTLLVLSPLLVILRRLMSTPTTATSM